MAETQSLKDNPNIKKRDNVFSNEHKVVAGTKKNSSNTKKASTAGLPSMIFEMPSDGDYSNIRNYINKRNPDERVGYAYDVAVELARREQENERRLHGFNAFNNEADLTRRIDRIFPQISPEGNEVSGADMRGENAFTQALGGIREGIHGFNNMIGTGLDWGVDRFGDLVGLVSGRDDWRQSIQDATTGEDLAFIPSIIEDLGIAAATGPVGAAAILGAKGFLENSDSFQEAFTGKDHLTGEDLTGMQRAGNLLSGTLGTGLTMLPGFSAAKAGTKLVNKELGESAKTAVKNLKEDEKIVDKLGKEVLEAGGKDIKTLRAERQALVSDLKEQQKIAKGYAGDKRKAAEEAIANIKKQLDPLNKDINAAKRFGNVDAKRTKLAEASERIDQALAPESAIQQNARWRLFSAPYYGEEAVEGASRIPMALRNPFSAEARGYNAIARNAARENLARAWQADREKGLGKALFNIINGRTFGAAAGFDKEAEEKAIELAKNAGKDEAKTAAKAGEEAAEGAAKAGEEATEATAKEASKAKGKRKTILSMLTPQGINASTKGAGGKLVSQGLTGIGGIRGLGLTSGSALAESMANTSEGGMQEALNNLADSMNVPEGEEGRLIPLFLAMMPGYRRGFARAMGGTTTPYYGAKALAARAGVEALNDNQRYTDEDEANLLKAVKFKKEKKKKDKE